MAAVLCDGAKDRYTNCMPPQPFARTPILLLVLGLHILLFWVARLHQGVPEARRVATAPASAPLWLRWIDERVHADAQRGEPLTASPSERKAPSRPPPVARRDRPDAVAPISATQPHVMPDGGDAAATPTEEVSPHSGSGRAPLNLTLPRGDGATWRRVNPALVRADLERPTRTIESFVAGAMLSGHGPWTEERVDPDTIRLRRGELCVVIKRPRIDHLDPYNASVSPKPWMVSQPTSCR